MPQPPLQLSYMGEQPLILSDDHTTELRDYLDVLLRHAWMIGWVTLIVTLLGTLYAFTARPVYEASLMVQVEEKGQRDPKNILGEAGAIIDYKTAASAEVELLRSRLVIARAIDRLGLNVSARPERFPIIGGLIAATGLAEYLPALRGLGGYAWGDERIEVGVFDVPEYLENRSFSLRVLGGGRYHLSDADSGISIEGRAGQSLSEITAYGPLDLHIDKLVGVAGTRFSLVCRSRVAAIEAVQKAMDVQEVGKQSGVIVATLKGGGAVEVYRLLTEISREYLAQNGARRTEEADRSLAYLNQRLPEVKQQLEQAEARYNAFRNTHGAVDVGEEGRLNLQRSSAARTRKIELEQKRTELLSRYTAAHPAVTAIDQQVRELAQELRDTATQLRQLPLLEQEMVRLAREVKINSELYTALITSAQQLQLIRVARTSNVRLIDTPERPDQPVTPNRPRIIAVAMFLGICIGVLLAFLRRSIRRTVDDPEQLERMFGLPIYASIPHSQIQQTLVATSRDPTKLPLLSRVASMDIAVEGLRNLRSALQFCMKQSSNNIVLITGPTEGIGKSFLSVNLAALMAASGKRVLLIDGDLRDGQLHRYFHSERANGLADLLNGAPIERVLRPSVLENLDFIATGSLPVNPAELLLRTELATMLSQLAPQYDLVLIDAAPLLAVADSLVLGTHAGAILLAARAGRTLPGEIAEALKRLARAGLAAKGMVFNDLAEDASGYRYGKHYGYGKLRQIGYSHSTKQATAGA
jgi:tyrosine-protein kinase Etk/Wzc